MIKFLKVTLNNNFWLTGTLTYCTAFIAMILIPVYYWFLPPLMILWGLVWIFEIRKRTCFIEQIPPSHKGLYILLFCFYLWQIVGMLYTDNQHEGWRNISLRFSLFFFPLILINPGEFIRRRIMTLVQVFAISAFLYVLFCFGYALFRSLDFQNGILTFNPYMPDYDWVNYFYGFQLAIFQHPSYLSMYIILALFIALESLFEKSGKRKIKIFWFAVSIILLISIYFLSSRAAILTTIITLPAYFLYRFRMYGINRRVGISVLVTFLISIPVLLTNPRVNFYLKGESKKEWVDRALHESRIVMWTSAFNIVRNNIIFGVGTGDTQDELNKEYLKSSLRSEVKGKNFNAHNQFIEVMVENGLIGLMLLVSVFIMIFYISLSKKNILYFIFAIIVIVSFMFETMLNRLAGITFFAIFSFLLLHSGSGIKKSSEL